MATFESRISKIFDEHPRFRRKIPSLIRQLFNETEPEFKRRLKNAPEEEVQQAMLKLFDILFIDYYFDEINDWFLNWVVKNYPENFNKDELKEMRSQAASHLDYYEVIEVFPGEGSRIRSLYTEKEYVLLDKSSSRMLTKWDIVLMRRYSMGDVSFATGSVLLFRAIDRQYILKKIEEAHNQYMTLSNNEDYADFAKNRWDVFIQIEKELQENYKKKTYLTKYGNLQFCEVRFQVNDLNAILKKIEDLDELHFNGQKVKNDKKKKRKLIRYDFDWFTSGIEDALSKISPSPEKDGIIFTTHQLDYKGKQTGIEVIGQFSIDRYLARLETNSVELAEFAKEHFTSIFGQAIKFKRIIMKNMEKIFDEKHKSDKKEPVQKVNAHIQKTMMEELYLNILDIKVPALNNLTPREARKDINTLPLLISWLKEIENMEEKKKRQGQMYFSINKLKKELDIDF